MVDVLSCVSSTMTTANKSRVTVGTGTYLDTSDAVRIPSALTNVTKTAHSVARFENSYRLEPEAKFPTSALKKAMEEILEEVLSTMKYDREKCGELCRTLADAIREKAKSLLETDQYKVVAFVVIGQKDDATVAMCSRCVWHEKFDQRAEASFSNQSLYAVAIAYGIYHE